MAESGTERALKRLDMSKDSGILTRFGEEVYWSSGIRGGFRTALASDRIIDNDYSIFADSSTEKVIMTLPKALQVKGQLFVLKNIEDTNGVELAANGDELIDDSSSNIAILLNETTTVQSDGVGWKKVSNIQNIDLSGLVPYTGATGDIDLGNTYRVENMIDPVSPQDAATKQYVDDNDHWQRNGTSVSPKVITDSVGIGTTTPGAELDVIGDIRASQALFLGSGSSDNLYFWPDTTGSYITHQVGAQNTALQLVTKNNHDIVLSPGGGNVGIGTTTPTSLLNVGAPSSFPWDDSKLEVRDGMRVFDSASSSFGLRVGVDSEVGFIQGYRETVGTSDISLQKDGGNVGIGTTTPDSTLHVAGTAKIETSGEAISLEIKENTIDPIVRISNGGSSLYNPELQFYRNAAAYGFMKYEPDGGNSQGWWLGDIRSDTSAAVRFLIGGRTLTNQVAEFNQFNLELRDDYCLALGTGVDATICYDGTDMIINPKKVGSGKLRILGESKFEGGIIKEISIKTADYTILPSDYTIIADATNNTVTITLPAAPITGQIFVVKCKDATNTCTIGRNGKNIDGAASDVILALNEVATLQYDGTEWWTI